MKKCASGPFLYDTKSSDYRDQHTRANACEGIGKELKIKRKFYLSSRDVRIVYLRLKALCGVVFHFTCIGLVQCFLHTVVKFKFYQTSVKRLMKYPRDIKLDLTKV